MVSDWNWVFYPLHGASSNAVLQSNASRVAGNGWGNPSRLQGSAGFLSPGFLNPLFPQKTYRTSVFMNFVRTSPGFTTESAV